MRIVHASAATPPGYHAGSAGRFERRRRWCSVTPIVVPWAAGDVGLLAGRWTGLVEERHQLLNRLALLIGCRDGERALRFLTGVGLSRQRPEKAREGQAGARALGARATACAAIGSALSADSSRLFTSAR